MIALTRDLKEHGKQGSPKPAAEYAGQDGDVNKKEEDEDGEEGRVPAFASDQFPDSSGSAVFKVPRRSPLLQDISPER